MDNDINFEQFQREINVAESYLQSGHVSTDSASFRRLLSTWNNPPNFAGNTVDTISFPGSSNNEINYFEDYKHETKAAEDDAEAVPIDEITNDYYEFENRTVENVQKAENQSDVDDQNGLTGYFSAKRQLRYLKSREDLIKEADEAFLRTHSFHPTLERTVATSTHVSQQFVGRSTSSSRSRAVSPIRAESVDKSRPKTAGKHTEFRVTPRLEELYSSHLDKRRELESQRRQMGELELRQCTFQPQLSKGTNSLVERRRHRQLELDESSGHAGEADVTQRLFEEAELRVNQQRWVQKQVVEARSAQYSFQPSINPHNASYVDKEGDHRPIYTRIAGLQRDKKMHMQQLRQSIEDNQTDLTFRPQINPRSRVMAERRQLGLHHSSTAADALSGEMQVKIAAGIAPKDVGSRLMDEGRLMTRRKQQLVHEREKVIADSLESPVVSKGSLQIARNSDLVNARFEERQNMIQLRIKQKMLQRQVAEERQLQKLFQPETTEKAAAILAKTRPHQLNETSAERVERMAYQDAATMEARRHALEQEVYGDISFSPQIDPLSRALGRESSVQELSENARGRQRRELVRRRAEERANQECTFRPRINQLSRELLLPPEDEQDLRLYQSEFVAHGWADESAFEELERRQNTAAETSHTSRINMKEPEKMARDIRLHLLEREERRRSELLVREVDELRECTFQPAVTPYVPVPMASSVVIKGLGRHLELRHLSERQKQSAAEREREVFGVRNVEKFRRAEDGSTIVHAFRFGSSKSTPLSS